VLGEEKVSVGMPSCETSTASYSGCGSASFAPSETGDRTAGWAGVSRYCSWLTEDATDSDDSETEGEGDDVASENTWHDPPRYMEKPRSMCGGAQKSRETV
jgi:hypothetical protein